MVLARVFVYNFSLGPIPSFLDRGVDERSFSMIRFLGLNAYIAVVSILFCLWGLLLSLFNRDGSLLHRLVAVPWAKMILWGCSVRVMVRGQENVENQLPRIYFTNHQSYFDIFALLAFLPADFKFVLKQELMKIPLLGPTMRRAGYIGIDRDDPRKAVKSMNEAARKVKKGFSIVMFPEGTRSEDGRLQPFKKGGFRLALKAGCEVVPVAIINSRKVVPKGSLRINRGSFAMNIGKPIAVTEYSKKEINELMARVRDAIAEQMGETVDAVQNQ